MKRLLVGLATGLFLFGIVGMAHAIPLTSTTGDLGNNVIWDAGSFDIFLDADLPSTSISSILDIKYGLWNSPLVIVDTFFNGTLLGSFTADHGYISPGPKYISFDITGLLVDGANHIMFTGNGANSGDYVVGQVDMNYDGSSAPVPEPATMLLFGTGLVGLVGSRLRKEKK